MAELSLFCIRAITFVTSCLHITFIHVTSASFHKSLVYAWHRTTKGYKILQRKILYGEKCQMDRFQPHIAQ